jgi:hypothetical protein
VSANAGTYCSRGKKTATSMAPQDSFPPTAENFPVGASQQLKNLFCSNYIDMYNASENFLLI